MPRNEIKTTVAVGATVSGVVNGLGKTPAGVYIPSNFTGTSLKFNAYSASGAFMGMVGDGAGSDYTKTLASSKSQYISLSKDLMAGIDQLQLVSGSAQSGADAACQIVFE
jgi:hypothetical protein